MCGIAGEIRFDGRRPDSEAVRRMLPRLESRGPRPRQPLSLVTSAVPSGTPRPVQASQPGPAV